MIDVIVSFYIVYFLFGMRLDHIGASGICISQEGVFIYDFDKT